MCHGYNHTDSEVWGDTSPTEKVIINRCIYILAIVHCAYLTIAYFINANLLSE